MPDRKERLRELNVLIESALGRICKLPDDEYKSGMEFFKEYFGPRFGDDLPCVLKMIEDNRAAYKSLTN